MLPRREPCQQRGDGAAAPDRVAVDAADPRLRKQRRDLGFDPLGAESDLLEILAAALATQAFGTGDGVVAVVAAGATGRAVDGQRQAAVRALERRAALPAEHRRWRSRAG